MTLTIDIEKVKSVYSGIDGKCCCGCSGKYSYASAHREAAGKERGYPIDDEDINDRTVKLIVGKVLKSGVAEQERDNLISAVVGKRLYLVRL